MRLLLGGLVGLHRHPVPGLGYLSATLDQLWFYPICRENSVIRAKRSRGVVHCIFYNMRNHCFIGGEWGKLGNVLARNSDHVMGQVGFQSLYFTMQLRGVFTLSQLALGLLSIQTTILVRFLWMGIDIIFAAMSILISNRMNKVNTIFYRQILWWLRLDYVDGP